MRPISISITALYLSACAGAHQADLSDGDLPDLPDGGSLDMSWSDAPWAPSDLGIDLSEPPADLGADLGIDAATDAATDAHSSITDLGVDLGVDASASLADLGVDLNADAHEAPADLGTDAAPDAPWSPADFGVDLPESPADLGVDLGPDAALDASIAAVDECTLGTDSCTNDQHCQDTPSGYTCHDVTSVIAAGYNSTCARFDNGAVKCWGDNSYGQLGYGDTLARSAPEGHAIDLGVHGAVSLTAGFYHVCALLDDGSVKCWGVGTSGQIGDGSGANAYAPSATVALGEGRSALQIDAGDYHTCAVLDDHTLKCWGRSAEGQLGYGDYNARFAPPNTPMDIGAGRTALSVGCGDHHSCVLLDDHTVKCWGDNRFGSLGYGDADVRLAPATTPVALGPSRTATSLVVGAYHACATLDNGTVTCWGYNEHGQLAIGDTDNHSAAGSLADFSGSGTPVMLTSGQYHMCGILMDDSLRCWGYNGNGQLGYGNTASQIVPIATPVANDVAAVSTWWAHTCIVTSDAQAKCWGWNDYGQLGYDDFTSSLAPRTETINLRGR